MIYGVMVVVVVRAATGGSAAPEAVVGEGEVEDENLIKFSFYPKSFLCLLINFDN